jgi:hypothetical protein
MSSSSSSRVSSGAARRRVSEASRWNRRSAGPGGEIVDRYDKAHLTPYGEYLPMRPILSRLGLSRLAPGDLDFLAGPGPRTLDLGRFGSAGVQICYEIIFSGNVVDAANRPDFIFNPSNDAWFGAWGPPQHLAQARLRAIEEGLPVLRATPTGVSAVIDAEGRLLQSLPWREAGAIDARLPAPKPPTLFARFGNALVLLFALLFTTLLGPIVLVALVAAPGHFRDFYQSEGGMVVVAIAALASLLGVWLLGRLGRDPVEERVLAGAASGDPRLAPEGRT